MAVASTGFLSLVRGDDGELRIERSTTKGDLKYRISGGDMRQSKDQYPWSHYHWVTRFAFAGKTLQAGFDTGMALPDVPEVDGILEALFADAHAFSENDSLEEFCDAYGYDPALRESERVFKSCGSLDTRLRNLFADEFSKWEDVIYWRAN